MSGYDFKTRSHPAFRLETQTFLSSEIKENQGFKQKKAPNNPFFVNNLA